jgi:hypothetical protein
VPVHPLCFVARGAQIPLLEDRLESHGLGVLAVPQHAEGEAIDVILQPPDEAVEGVPITLDLRNRSR